MIAIKEYHFNIKRPFIGSIINEIDERQFNVPKRHVEEISINKNHLNKIYVFNLFGKHKPELFVL